MMQRFRKANHPWLDVILKYIKNYSATEAAVLATIIHKRHRMHSPGNRNITVLATIIGFDFTVAE